MTVLASAFWRRLDIPGSDVSHLRQSADGYELTGNAVFLDTLGPTALRYTLDLSTNWQTREGRICGFIGDRAIDDHIVRTRHGWTMNGRDFGMAEVLDLDLGFTPATNMAQVKRLGLAVGDKAEFNVAWLDTGADALKPLLQQYRRIGEYEYDYRSPVHDFHATLTLQENGFVAVYPGLWADGYQRESGGSHG